MIIEERRLINASFSYNDGSDKGHFDKGRFNTVYYRPPQQTTVKITTFGKHKLSDRIKYSLEGNTLVGRITWHPLSTRFIFAR